MKNINNIILAVLFIFSSAQCDELKLTIGMKTYHTPPTSCEYDTCKPFNTDNKLLVLSTENVIFGKMVNSYGNESFLAGVKGTLPYGNFVLDYGLLVATGYPRGTLKGPVDGTSGQIVIAPLLNLSFNVTKNLSVELSSQVAAVNIGVGLRI